MKKLMKQSNRMVIKKALGQIAAVTVLLFSLSSCNKDPVDDEADRLPPPSSARYADLKKLADELVNNHLFAVEDGTEYTSPKGTKITFAPNSLVDEDNNDITGEVELTFVEIYDRGTMVSSDKALMGIDGEHLTPLVTGGQFFVQVKQDDRMLKPKPGNPYKVVLDARHTGGVDTGMKIWKGNKVRMAGDPIPDIDITVNQCCPSPNALVVWSPANSEQTWLQARMDLSSYQVFSTDEFGWTNIDRFYTDDREKTQIKVFVPVAYNHENSAVYLAYAGEPGVLARLDVYDTEENYFSEHYGYVPVGLNVHLIFTSESNGSVVYAIKTVTITANGTFSFSTEDMKTTAENDLVSMINALD